MQRCTFCQLCCVSTLSVSSEYGFAEKVVEGMSLSINSIIIKISAKAFNASFELSQLQVYSVNTSWSIGDLRYTRIQDPQRGEVSVSSPFHWDVFSRSLIVLPFLLGPDLDV